MAAPDERQTSINYLLADHLGSVLNITDSSGSSLIGLSFDAYGDRRGSNWTGDPSSGELDTINGVTRRGFTEHEMLDSVGLVQMNGRVYNPVTGRFVSADPYIDGLLSSQGWNRYSYIGNQTMAGFDPSGFNNSCQGGENCADFNGRLQTVDVFGSSYWDLWYVQIMLDIFVQYLEAVTRFNLVIEVSAPSFRITGALDPESQCDSQEAVRDLIPEMRDMMNEHVARVRIEGIDARVGSTFRSYEAQDALYAQGRDGNPGSIVTRAQGGQSMHNFGLAYDLNIYDENGDYLTSGDDWRYSRAGEIGQSMGLEWGGAWTSFKDVPHFELDGGFPVEVLRTRVEQCRHPFTGF